MTAKTRFLNFFRKIFTYRPLEDVLFFFVRGSKYLGLRSRIIPNPILYKLNSLRRVNRNGINYELDLSCLMQWYVYWDFSAEDRNKLYSLVKKGDVVFDVGTNMGETLLNFAKLTGETGFVYGFEPDDTNYKDVQKNISLNNFKNVHVFKLAVSDKKETVRFYRPEPHNRGMNRILGNDQGANASYTTMETTTLDDVIESNNIQQVNLVKIDIEGYEMHAIRGATKTIQRFKPVFFIEVGYTRLLENKTSPNELIRLMENAGYKIYHAQTNAPISAEYDFSYVGDGSVDIVAIPK
jgi:FkbM family methyltransferase